MTDSDAFARFLDLFSGQAADDLPVYLGFAQRTGGPVLELGCGTGRVLLALACEGLEVTGVDHSPAVLSLARRKLERDGLSGPVALVQADVRDLDLAAAPSLTLAGGKGAGSARPYRLAICAQNTFCHMLTVADQLRLLGAAYRHLEPGGLLVLDVFNPDPAVLAGDERRLVLMGVTVDPDTGHTLTQTMARDMSGAGEQIEHVTLFVDELDGARLTGRHVFQFDLRYVYRFELELLLDKAGFTLEALYGSYELDPFTGDSERLLAVARR
ncbi:MAG: class I SAM-dependent methyltransferase [Thermoflexales bacterium]|nr:class I SAM-dependent methyltransferase [Thermoflexales bacterium]